MSDPNRFTFTVKASNLGPVLIMPGDLYYKFKAWFIVSMFVQVGGEVR